MCFKQGYLHNPVLVNKKIWRLKITVDYDRSTVVQIIHSTSLVTQAQEKEYYKLGLFATFKTCQDPNRN